MGALCLRLRGSYLSLSTLAFPLIAPGLLFAFPNFSGGELGISGLRTLAASRIANYYIMAVAMLAHHGRPIGSALRRFLERLRHRLRRNLDRRGNALLIERQPGPVEVPAGRVHS